MRLDVLRRNKLYLSLAIAMILVFVGAAYQSVFGESEAASIWPAETPDSGVLLSSGANAVTGSETAFLGPNTIADVAERVKKSVVTIEATPEVSQRNVIQRYPYRDPFFDPFWYFFGIDPYQDQNPEDYSPSSGSGFIFSEDGYILTNNHVVSGNKKITVTLEDGSEYEAQVVRNMNNPDVAVLKIDAGDKDLIPVKLGKSGDVRPGEWTIAIGNPLNLGITVTAGIVSATHRGDDPRIAAMFGDVQIPPDGFIQTDAAINPGNSGGPLVNLKGEVIGINTAMVLGGQNVGFAIPIDSISHLLPRLMTESKGGYLGVELWEVDEAYAERLGVSGGAVVIANVIKGYPAERAGLRAWDVIIRVDDHEVRSLDDLVFTISSHAPGEEVEITYVRDRTVKSVKVKLAEAPSE